MITTAPIEKLIPNPEQPRVLFDEVELNNLAESIRENGVILPIVVEEVGDLYIIHDGERRWRAAKLAGLSAVPIAVSRHTESDPEERLTRALVANLQRADLTPIEEARAYDRLVSMGKNAQQVARKVGKHRAYVANRLLLLRYELEIQELIHTGQFPSDPALARAMLELDSQTRVILAQRAAKLSQGAKNIIHAIHMIQRRGASFSPKTPALQYSGKEPNLSKWNALQQLGELPPWKVVVESAEAACNTCVLRAEASPEICGQCPSPVLIRFMIQISNGER